MTSSFFKRPFQKNKPLPFQRRHSHHKKIIIRALKTGKLYPFRWPPNYGKYTHVEVCRWAGIDDKILSPPPHEVEVTPFPDIGISYRAWRVPPPFRHSHHQKGCPPRPPNWAAFAGPTPGNYGKVTHVEVCRWAGVVNPRTRPSARSREYCSHAT